MSQEYIVVVGYSARQLAKKLNESSLLGYKAIGTHFAIYIEDGDVWEYTMVMELDDGST